VENFEKLAPGPLMRAESNIDIREGGFGLFCKSPSPPNQISACVLNSCSKHNTTIRRHLAKRRGLPIHHRRPSVVSSCRTSR